MVFSSIPFLFRFLPVAFLLYFILPRKLRNLVLFVSSLIFYSWGEPIYVSIMLFSTMVDYTHGRMVHTYLNKNMRGKAKAAVASSMVINLALLCFFKYSNFFITNINDVFQTAIPLLKISMPIGISFYTFQTMSYTIDVYRGDAKVQKNIISFGTYVALFPQLIAGPIVQFKTIAKQLDERKEDVNQFAEGVIRLLIGLGKKILLANNIGMLWDSIKVMDPNGLPAVTAWIGVLAFAFQIYFDFSGYSDMAIGLGKMLGFHFLENFNYPYLSKNITEFWRRWHISLGTWFRDYVYIPLGGNRCSAGKQIRNIAIVWLLTGFWHGAEWNFILWGAYFGVLLIIEKKFLLKFLDRMPGFLQHSYAIVIVLISWVIFELNINQILPYLKAMFAAGGGIYNEQTLYILSSYLPMLVILTIAVTDWPKRIVTKLQHVVCQRKNIIAFGYVLLELSLLIGGIMIGLAYLVNSSYNPFLYFRF